MIYLMYQADNARQTLADLCALAALCYERRFARHANVLLDATDAACKRAGDRTSGVYALRSGLPVTDAAIVEAEAAIATGRLPRAPSLQAAERALRIAEHAEERANARDMRVRREVIEPWIATQHTRRVA